MKKSLKKKIYFFFIFFTWLTYIWAKMFNLWEIHFFNSAFIGLSFIPSNLVTWAALSASVFPCITVINLTSFSEQSTGSSTCVCERGRGGREGRGGGERGERERGREGERERGREGERERGREGERERGREGERERGREGERERGREGVRNGEGSGEWYWGGWWW